MTTAADSSFTPVLSQHAPPPIGPYSQAIACGGMLYCSGQIPLDPATGELVAGDITTQTEQVMKNISAVLGAAGISFANVVKTTIYLTDMADFPKVNLVYGTAFNTAPPARSTVAVAALPKGANVEIEVLAILPVQP